MADRSWTVNTKVAIKAVPSIRGTINAVVPTSSIQEQVPLYTVRFDQSSKYSDQNYLGNQLISEAEAVQLEAEAKAKADKEKGKGDQ